MDLECGKYPHNLISFIAMAGLFLWSLCPMVGLFWGATRRSSKRELQRRYLYLTMGLEPRACYWEVAVKRLDLLLSIAITYTNIAPVPQAKCLLYTIQSG